MRISTVAPLILFSLAYPAIAQTHFCIAGDLDHLNATQVTECRTKMTNVRDAVKRHGAPSGWRFVVVCDATGWSDYARFIAPGTASLREAAFHTDEHQRWTFVRGDRIDAGAEAADTLLAVVLRGVTIPKTEPMPNPKRVLRQPTLSIASVEPPQLP